MSGRIERDRRVVDLLNERADQPDRGPLEVVVDRTWRFLCSVRAALYEIGFLALLVLIGTLQGSTIPAQIPRLVPALEPVIERWYAFDVFHSTVFTLTLTLLAIAIVVCTVNRVPGIWAAVQRPTVKTTVGFFDGADLAAELSTTTAPERTGENLAVVLRKRRYRVMAERQQAAVHIYADKHRLGRLGTFPFHLALILIFVGGIVGSEYGFREQVFSIPEGSIRDVGHGTGLRVELVRFVDNYSEIGAPTSYRSDLVLYDGEREVKRQSITVNHPLTYNNATFYQSSFGPAATVRITDDAGNTLFDDGVAFNFMSRTNAAAPAALVELPAQGLRFELVFPNTVLDAQPEIGSMKLYPGEMFVQARDWRTNELLEPGVVIGQGETIPLAGVHVGFVRERRFTVLQVAYNPGIPILFAASLLIVAGLIVTFGLPHRRIRGLIRPTENGSHVLLAPMARRDWSGKRHFLQTLASVERHLGVLTPYQRTQRNDVE
ncbi:MAG: cytochrome c biogenesis protein ResB [Thermomicrobiales bacterium]|nr:cytochrome c biogenesis protein ResB [Thermomicrobiales bacterium]